MEKNTIPATTNRKELNSTVLDSLKFLEKILGNIINHTEAIYSFKDIDNTSVEENQENFSQYVTNKLHGILQLFREEEKVQYCDLIAKTINNETFSVNDLIEQFKQIEWITNGYHSLEAKLVDSPNLDQGINSVDNLLMQYLSGKIVASYIIDKNCILKLLHQCSTHKDLLLPKNITKGTGALGTLIENNYTFLGATPNELITETNKEYYPKYIFCLPILMNNVIEGMLFIGKDTIFSAKEKKFLNICQTHLAAFLNYNRTKGQLIVMQGIIEEQTEKLKFQSEELITQKETLIYHRSKAEALEKKTLNLNDALNQKTQIIESIEEKIDSLQQSLANKTRSLTVLENTVGIKEQELNKVTEKANVLEKQVLEKNQRIESINEKLVATERTITTQSMEMEALNTELHQIKAIVKKQTEVLNTSNSKADYLECLATAVKNTVNEYFVFNENQDNQHEMINNMYLGKNELLNLISDIQELSNIQNHNAGIQLMPTSLAEVFVQLKQQFEPVAISKGLAFSIEQSNDICNYQKTDEIKLQKILSSLLAYAFKSTDIGAIQIKAYKPDHINYKNMFAISIADTGIGLSATKQKTIFEPFNLENFDKHNGTGLTLKLAYEYAKLLAAELQVKSQEGLGTTFTLYLPIENCSTEDLHNTYEQNINSVNESSLAELTRENTVMESNIHANIETVHDAVSIKQQSLLIMHDEVIYKNINKLLRTVAKDTCLVSTADMAYKKIKSTAFTRIIISLQHPDLPGFKWLISQLKREGMLIPPCILYVPYTMNTRENELTKKYMRDYGVKLAKNPAELLEEVMQNLCGEQFKTPAHL